MDGMVRFGFRGETPTQQSHPYLQVHAAAGAYAWLAALLRLHDLTLLRLLSLLLPHGLSAAYDLG